MTPSEFKDNEDGTYEVKAIPSEKNTLLKVMVGLLTILVVFLGWLSGHQYYEKFLKVIEKHETKDSLTLISPNGKNHIILKATDSGSLISMYRYEGVGENENLSGPQILLQNSKFDGCKLGLYYFNDTDRLVGITSRKGESYPLLQGVDRNDVVWDILHRVPIHEIGAVGAEPPVESK